jgi:hypothetical protein
MTEAYGKTPEYSEFGRPPYKKWPQPDWKYLQMIKERNGKGKFFEIRLKPVYGDLKNSLNCLGKMLLMSSKLT